MGSQVVSFIHIGEENEIAHMVFFTHTKKEKKWYCILVGSQMIFFSIHINDKTKWYFPPMGSQVFFSIHIGDEA